MPRQKKKADNLPKCLRCGSQGVGLKAIICQNCFTELFGDAEKLMVFCKKCKKAWAMTEEEKINAERLTGVQLDTLKSKKIMLVLESCPNCYLKGDSQEAQFAVLNQVSQV